MSHKQFVVGINCGKNVDGTGSNLRKKKVEVGGQMAESSCPTIAINVKFSGRSIPLNVSPDSKVKELKTLLQSLTNVLPRGQKLISKGKVLVDELTLRESEVTNGAKIMLIASMGLHQGDGPILKEAQSFHIPIPSPRWRKIEDSDRIMNEKIPDSADNNRVERWKATGVIPLSERHLKAIPDEVWACGVSARVLDLRKNLIKEVPSTISSLTSIQKLYLDANAILDNSISWEGLVSLKHLMVLSLNDNLLETLPSALGSLTSLCHLSIAHNKLTSLPDEIRHLTKMEILEVNHNRIRSIPTSIGDCTSLFECIETLMCYSPIEGIVTIELSSNLLMELPESLGHLHNLKALRLRNNGIKSLPSALLKTCVQLCTLDLHNTEITTDVLRRYEGWEEFDERRRSKHQKQLDFRVVGSAEFDEGAGKHF